MLYIKSIFFILSLSVFALLLEPVYANPFIQLPKTSLAASDLAVIVNDEDPLSVKIANYYQTKRKIPDGNIIHIRFKPQRAVLPVEEFLNLKKQVDTHTPDHIQAYALTWAAPFRVDCMSITSAFALGYDKAYCAKGCNLTKQNPYYNSNSRNPYQDLGIRPTISIAATDFENAKQLIDKGVASNYSFPQGTGYLVSTNDRARNSRAPIFPDIIEYMKNVPLKLVIVNTDYIENKNDVLFYFTGLKHVPKIETLNFLPGAITDHLTSSGGALTGTIQMSSLRWLEAGATGSYGAVIEPCNFPQKFPNPGIVIDRYFNGESLLESYWKSVLQPGQGIFIGEPLANPFGGYSVQSGDDWIQVHTQVLRPGAYMLLSSYHPGTGFQPDRQLLLQKRGMQTLRLTNLDKPFYKLVRINTPSSPDKSATDHNPKSK
jgi:uncharacterized protein (TIGR03790 family)